MANKKPKKRERCISPKYKTYREALYNSLLEKIKVSPLPNREKEFVLRLLIHRIRGE